MLEKPPPPDDPEDPHLSSVIPQVVPPLPRENPHARDLPWQTAIEWLKLGWADFRTNPMPSVVYGMGVFLVSLLIVWGLFRFGLDYILFPALSGFLVVGPLIANGLYEKSRRLEQGERTGLSQMLFVRPASGAQIFFLGVMLLGLMLLWWRAAVILYALIFGVRPFPGFEYAAGALFTTWAGGLLLVVGFAVGGLFAAFGFAISVFAVPMMLEERTDALTAMGISMTLVWNNLQVMLSWGAIVAALFAVAVLTGFLGMIVIFPVLGHATWHAYRAMRSSRGERVFFLPA
jgi:uncharacterized membrane protein